MRLTHRRGQCCPLARSTTRGTPDFNPSRSPRSHAHPSVPFFAGGNRTRLTTSFANPAVTLARAATNTFAGIAPPSVPGYLAGQVVGAVGATLFARWLLRPT